MIKIHIARHGETTWNAEGRIQGRSDPELTLKGSEQSLMLFTHLKDRPISAVYTSALQRTIRTARPLADYLGLSVQVRPEMDEMDYGLFEGKRFSEVGEELITEWRNFRENRLTYRLPGGESYSDLLIRIRPLTVEIREKHKGEEILMVGHRGVNRVLIALFTGRPLQDCLGIDQSNDCIYLIEENGDLKITHHLNGRSGEGLLFL